MHGGQQHDRQESGHGLFLFRFTFPTREQSSGCMAEPAAKPRPGF
jgi:hypothetical protein